MTDEQYALEVEEHLRLHSNIPSRRIAIILNQKFPERTVESFRSMVRHRRGALGVYNRTNLATDEFLNQKYDLPLPSKYDSSNFVIPEKTVLILSDLQIPFHDIKALETAIGWAKQYNKGKRKIDAILLNGDIMDMYQLSDFSRDPRERKIPEEIADAKDLLDMLREEFGVPMYWKFGNHEERYDRYMYRQCKELIGIEEFQLENILKLKNYNCTVIKDKRIINIGHLNVIHGHEFRGGIFTTVNPARTFYTKAKEATLGGDRHQTSEHSEKTINGKLITCWSTGCLCDLKPLYAPINNWNHGFALVENEGDTFRVHNIRISNGVIY